MSAPARANICSRSYVVVVALEQQLQLSCRDIEAGDLSQVEELTLELAAFPQLRADDFIGLNKLSSLTFERCEFDRFDSDDVALENLKELTINRSKIRNFGTNPFEKFPKLQNLTMKETNLTALPARALSSLPELTFLWLSSTYLNRLPTDFFSGLTKLTGLYFTNHPNLEPIDPATFAGLTELTTLDLRNNNLGQIDKEIFANKPKIHELNFSQNHIVDMGPLPTDLFQSVPDIAILDLSRNGLSEISAELFQTNTKLGWLMLGYNRFQVLPFGIFTPFASRPSTVFLEQNQLKREEMSRLKEEYIGTKLKFVGIGF